MLKVPSIISKVSTMSDGGMRLVCDTQELKPEEKAVVMDYHNKVGWFVFFTDPNVKEIELPKEPVEFQGQKSLSERLYNKIYKLHKQRQGKDTEFEMFRKKEMEKLISWYEERCQEAM
jgi:hypothetical protein